MVADCSRPGHASTAQSDVGNEPQVDARWRIGWIMFDKDFSRVTARGNRAAADAVSAPARNAVDIAFAASAPVEDDLVIPCYALGDRVLRRAAVRAYRQINRTGAPSPPRILAPAGRRAPPP